MRNVLKEPFSHRYLTCISSSLVTQYNSFQSEVHDPGNTKECALKWKRQAHDLLSIPKSQNSQVVCKWAANWVVNPDLNEQKAMLLFCSVTHSVVFDSLRCHGLQHARLPCPSPSSGGCSNSRPLNQWCHPTISSSVVPFLLLPSIFLNIMVFPNESALHIRWPRYWSFSFSISPSNEYSEKISSFDYIDLCQQSDVFAFQYAV